MSRPADRSTSVLLKALSGVMAQVAEPIQVLKTLLDQAVQMTGADRGVFVEVSSDGKLDFQVLHHFERKELRGDAGRFSRSVFSKVIRTGKAELIKDAGKSSDFMAAGSIINFRMVSILCMPIIADGRVAALVHLENDRPGHFGADHQELLGSLLEIAGPVLETLQAGRKVLEEKEELKAAEGRLTEETQESRKVLAREWSFSRFLGRSPRLHQLQDSLQKVSRTDFPVLLLGESGTGKSILARAIHSASPRSERGFITVFCPALQKEMVEAELFGHKKGAFTGALSDRTGKVQAAEKGTLFLDEIGDLPLEIQAKLLRLLQEKTYERVGDALERRADVRVIAATNRDLEQEVLAGRFRRDLFERLNFVPLHVPPLRERTEDIPLLLRHCLDQQDSGRWIKLSPEALDYLRNLDYAWPGNVRELEQLSARLILDAPPSVGIPEVERHLRSASEKASPAALAAATDPQPASAGSSSRAGGSPFPAALSGASLDAGLPELMQQTEKAWLEEALRRYPRLTRSDLAAKLKISEAALYKKLALYDLKAWGKGE